MALIRTMYTSGTGSSATQRTNRPEDCFSDLYARYSKPGLQKLLSLLKLDISYLRAQGENLFYRRDGREIMVIDLLGGYGSTILGHNHPQIKSVLQQCLDEDMPVHTQASIRPYSALLGEKINQILAKESPEQQPAKYITHLASTGTEAIEAALKLQ